MTHGVAGAMINAALILGELAPWVEVYDPSRKTPSAIGNFLKENVTAVKNFAEYLAPGELSDFSELKSGKARSSGRAYPRSRPIGTKMDRRTQAPPPARILAATYTGNSFEICWDCPCHGSQFAADGTALNAPAVKSLEKADLGS